MSAEIINNYRSEGGKLKFYYEEKGKDFGVCIKLNVQATKEPTPEQVASFSRHLISSDQVKGTPLEGVELTPITPEDFEKEGYDE